jgi:hypothetical protein
MLWQRQLLIVLCRWMVWKLRRMGGRRAVRGQWRNSGLLAGVLVYDRLSRSLVDGIRSLVDRIRSLVDGIRSLVDGIRILVEGRRMVPGFFILVGRSVVDGGSGEGGDQTW